MSHMAVLQNLTVKLFGERKKHEMRILFRELAKMRKLNKKNKFSILILFIFKENWIHEFVRKWIESLTQTLIFPLSLQIFYTTNTVFSNRSNNLSLKLLKFQRFTQSGFWELENLSVWQRRCNSFLIGINTT